jgi:hypothetical protein
MGGTDDPSNLIELTTEEHAEAHRLLWEEHGSIYDKIAWRCLSGQISNEEANIEATKAANTGRTPWNKGKKGVQGGRPKGMIHDEAARKMISEGTKKAMVGVECGRKKGCVPWNKGKTLGPQTPEHIEKRRQGVLDYNKRHKKGGE